MKKFPVFQMKTNPSVYFVTFVSLLIKHSFFYLRYILKTKVILYENFYGCKWTALLSDTEPSLYFFGISFRSRVIHVINLYLITSFCLQITSMIF